MSDHEFAGGVGRHVVWGRDADGNPEGAEMELQPIGEDRAVLTIRGGATRSNNLILLLVVFGLFAVITPVSLGMPWWIGVAGLGFIAAFFAVVLLAVRSKRPPTSGEIHIDARAGTVSQPGRGGFLVEPEVQLPERGVLVIDAVKWRSTMTGEAGQQFPSYRLYALPAADEAEQERRWSTLAEAMPGHGIQDYTGKMTWPEGAVPLLRGADDGYALRLAEAVSRTLGWPVWFFHSTPPERRTPVEIATTLTGSGLEALRAIARPEWQVDDRRAPGVSLKRTDEGLRFNVGMARGCMRVGMALVLLFVGAPMFYLFSGGLWAAPFPALFLFLLIVGVTHHLEITPTWIRYQTRLLGMAVGRGQRMETRHVLHIVVNEGTDAGRVAFQGRQDGVDVPCATVKSGQWIRSVVVSWALEASREGDDAAAS